MLDLQGMVKLSHANVGFSARKSRTFPPVFHVLTRNNPPFTGGLVYQQLKIVKGAFAKDGGLPNPYPQLPWWGVPLP